MENKNKNTENKKLKKLEEAELTVTLFDKDDIVVGTSGGCTDGNNDCLSKETQITMSDGSIKNIDDIVEGDMVMTFDHEAGCFVGSEVMYAFKGDAPKCAFTCYFANGAKLSIVGEHDLFEQESRKYVTLTEANAEKFIGKHFYSAEEKDYVELVGVIHETEAVDYYELYTKNTLNTIANGMLNVADDVDHMLNLYTFGEDLKANEKDLAGDIQKYGIFEYNLKYGYSEEDYNIWNMRYLNIAMGKRLITWDKLWSQHLDYTDQCGSKGTSECV